MKLEKVYIESNFDDFLQTYKKELESEKPIELTKLQEETNSTVVVFPQWKDPWGYDPLKNGKRNPAWYMFEDAKLSNNRLKRGRREKTLLSVGAGNYGIEIATIANRQDDKYPLLNLVSSRIPKESLEIFKVLGSDIAMASPEFEELCPRWPLIRVARKISLDLETYSYHFPQHSQSQNPDAQLQIMMPKIFESGYDFDELVIALGTGATAGAAEKYKRIKGLKNLKISAIQTPKNSLMQGPSQVKGEDCNWSPENFSYFLNGKEIYMSSDALTLSAAVRVFEREGRVFAPSTNVNIAKALYDGNKEERTIAVISMDNIFKYRDFYLDVLGSEHSEQPGHAPSFRKPIIEESPNLEEPLIKLMNEIRYYPSIEERLDIIKANYPTPDEEGVVYNLPTENVGMMKEIERVIKKRHKIKTSIVK